MHAIIVYRWKTNSADSGKWCIKCGARDCIRNSINIYIKYIHILHVIQKVLKHAGIKGEWPGQKYGAPIQKAKENQRRMYTVSCMWIMRFNVIRQG